MPESQSQRKRRRNLKYRYGITTEQYEIIYVRQNGCCAICATPSDRLVVDHNHANKELRGLLCQKCNKGLGLFNDSPAQLRAAASYLREGYKEPYCWKSKSKS